MQALLCEKLASLYEEHRYISDTLNDFEKSQFNKIRSGDFETETTINSLIKLSKYLKDYHGNKCIVLIDEYDYPLNVAYQYQYYEKAHGFFACLFGELLKVSTHYSYLL
jgi:hypothetical protein